MRQTLISSFFLLLAACGPSGDRPWDENRDGLVTACEGLNPFACAATPGCEEAPSVCTMECRDDGRGGCLPCPTTGSCQPVAMDCGHLSPDRCGFMPGCELVTQTVCDAGTATSGAPAQEDRADPAFAPPLPGCGGGCHAVEVCQARRPVACEDRSADTCLAQPGCALEVSVCTFSCDADSPCPPCANPVERCVTMAPPPPPNECEGRDLYTCEVDGRCALEAYACTAACESDGDGGCLPCPTSSRHCVPVP